MRSYNPRYQEVMANAFRLKSDPVARSAHLRKSKPCSNTNIHDENDCGFAHSVEDYRPPICFFDEFCHGQKNGQCSMFHGVLTSDTKKNYITKNNITFLSHPSRSITPAQNSTHSSPSSSRPATPPRRSGRVMPHGAFTRFCNGVSDTTTCQRAHGTCTFAHGIDQLSLPEDDEKYPIHSCECCTDYRNNVRRAYDKNHYCKARLALAQELGYDVKPFMLRNHLLNIADYVKMSNEQKELIDEIRAEEELINDENVEEVCDVLEKMGLAETIITDFAENSMNFAMEQERLDGDYDDDDDFRVIINPIHPEKMSMGLSDL